MVDKLNGVVVQCFATGAESEAALVVSVCDAPSYTLLFADGSRKSWRQDLTRTATPEETIKYWQDRALRAEEKIK